MFSMTTFFNKHRLTTLTLLLVLSLAGCKTISRLNPDVKREVRRPNIVPPVAWKGSLPSGSFRSQVPDRITLMHTGTSLAEGADAGSQMKRIQSEDMARGWGDLGAHFYIDPAGTIYQSRRVVIQGRIKEEKEVDPRGHIFITLIGNYNEREPAEPFKESFVTLLAWLHQHYSIPPEKIQGLNAYTDTGSPGSRLLQWMDSEEYRQLWNEILGIEEEK
jgi:hypothetical protein